MTTIYSALNINDTDRVFLSTLGQRVVYDAVQAVLSEHNAAMQAAIGLFVQGTTSDYKIRYKLPGNGKMQDMGVHPMGVPAAVKAYGQWDVAFPLYSFQDAIGNDRISMAYMTVQDLARQLNTVMIRHANTTRFQILKALLNNTQRTYVDELWGNLLIEPLANGDSVLYPPVLGSDAEATETHMLESGYAVASISATNDPMATIVAELEEHFGTPTGGSNILTLIDPTATSYVKAMTGFVPVEDKFVQSAITVTTLLGLPSVPGRLIGRTASGSWVSEWRWMPATYMLGIHLDAEKPLMKRVDPADTGLPTGLTLIARDENFPLESAYYEDRFGFGVANRLNGVAMEVANGGSYTIPSGMS